MYIRSYDNACTDQKVRQEKEEKLGAANQWTEIKIYML
jgi:hypothetical protein